MKKFFILALLGMSLLGARGSWADDNRMDKRFGIYAGLLSDPLLSYAGLNLAYNATDFLRLTGGAGFLAGTTTATSYYGSSSGVALGGSIGLGAKLLVPHMEFSPTVGLNLSETFIGSGSGGESGFFSGSQNTLTDILFLYPSVGFDYQAKDGFDIGLQGSVPVILSTNAEVTFQIGLIPGLNIGKFF